MEIDEPRILAGTSGFSYDDWIGPVYPKGTKKEEMLSYYATELKFKIVELNFTYYTMPAAKTFETMLKHVPDDFTFVVKTHGSMTHKIRAGDGSLVRDEGTFADFMEGLKPLTEAGRLKCVLAQFPIKFARSGETEEHLKWFVQALRPLKLTVELRNRGWVAQSAFDLLRSLDAGYCVVDEPDLPKLTPFTPVATSDLAYFRFHGRNTKWFDVPAYVRYDYLYSDAELRGFIEPVKRVAAQAGETLVFFNNHFQGSAAKNAQMFKELVGAK
ncbi:MAG: DUF72 domain-containing protein [Nitrospinae bacterium]|nr:DUF72 domain-containing protein [Nitrospinota bacterium]